MNVAMVRVGIDMSSNTGGIYGPLLKDNTFEFIPIIDKDYHLDERTYGNTSGRYNRPFVEYFPPRRQAAMTDQPMHVDPEFETFTYGDCPHPKTRRNPKCGLRRLQKDDVLIFYCGLEKWPFPGDRALYLIGHFEVEIAGLAMCLELDGVDVNEVFAQNFHVRHPAVYEYEREHLVLVKGSCFRPRASRLLKQAVKISEEGKNRAGRRQLVLSREMQQVFGNFHGNICIQRGLHWVDEDHVDSAAKFVRSLD